MFKGSRVTSRLRSGGGSSRTLAVNILKLDKTGPWLLGHQAWVIFEGLTLQKKTSNTSSNMFSPACPKFFQIPRACPRVSWNRQRRLCRRNTHPPVANPAINEQKRHGSPAGPSEDEGSCVRENRQKRRTLRQLSLERRAAGIG